jgi:hypothetical protein
MCRLFELVVVLVPPVLSLTVLADSVELVILPLFLPALVIALFNVLQVRKKNFMRVLLFYFEPLNPLEAY